MVVIRDTVTTGIGDIEFIAHNGHLFADAYDALIDDLKAYRIDFAISDPGIRCYLYGACISAPRISDLSLECK